MALQLLYVLLALVFVALNGFFVLAEFSIVKVRATRIRELSQRGNANATLVLRITSRLDAYLAAAQLGITLASLALGWIGERAFAHLLEPLFPVAVRHSVSIAIAFVLVTALHITLGEQVPKLIAIRDSQRAAFFAARPLRWFYHLFFVPLWILTVVSALVLRLIGLAKVSPTEVTHSEEELRMLLGASHEGGHFTLSRLLMMENILDFGTLSVRDVMVPPSKAVMLDASKPWPDNFETIQKSMHSRYPLIRGDRSKVEGVVHVKDVAVALGKAAASPDLSKIARVVFRVRDDLPLETLLTRFHQRGTHMAMVEDERGKWVGLVTLEDVMEELIGTIRDEFEPAKEERLLDLVPREAIDLELACATKEEAIRRMSERLARAVPGLAAEPLAQAVLKRENLASTGLGEGVAIPHARVPGLERPYAGFARSGGVEFGCLDGKPAEILFLVATPPHDEGAHVRVLGKISRLLSSAYLKERLLRAQTPDEVLEIFDVSDRSVPA